MLAARFGVRPGKAGARVRDSEQSRRTHARRMHVELCTGNYSVPVLVLVLVLPVAAVQRSDMIGET